MVRLMRKAALLMLVLLIGIGAVSCGLFDSGGESKVNFIYSWSEALSKAQTENKPIMIDFYTDWCKWCDELDSKTYSDDELSTFLNDNFICVKINGDNSSLDGTYSVGGYPTIVFTYPDGTEINRMQIVGQ